MLNCFSWVLWHLHLELLMQIIILRHTTWPFSAGKDHSPFEQLGIGHCTCTYIWSMTLGEFHTDKSRIVLNNDGAVITMFFYSMSFHMDFNTGLFRRPTKSWSTHQLNSIYTVVARIYIHQHHDRYKIQT